MNNIIVVAGLPASGKSEAKKRIADKVKREYEIIEMSDKQALITEVARDMLGRPSNPDGSIESPDTKLLNPQDDPFSWKMIFKTPKALNDAHEHMFDEITDLSFGKNQKRVILAEIAQGEEIQYPNGQWLRQAFDTYISQFRERRILDRSLFLDIRASFEVRRVRNMRRNIGKIPPEEFDKYFKDGGFITKNEQHRLTERYRYINNDALSFQKYKWLIDSYYNSFLYPGISKDGRFPFIEKPSVIQRKER